MLDAGEAVEAEQAKVGVPGASALAIQEEDAQPDPLQDLTERFEELVAAIGFRRRKPFDKTKVRCYNCDKTGISEMNVRNPNVLLARPLPQKPGPILPTLPDALPNPDADHNMQFKKKNRKKNTVRSMNLNLKKRETSKGD